MNSMKRIGCGVLAGILGCSLCLMPVAATQTTGETPPIAEGEGNGSVTEQVVTPDSYDAYAQTLGTIADAVESLEIAVDQQLTADFIQVTVSVPQDAKYLLGFLCHGTDKSTSPIEIACQLDGVYPFAEMKELSVDKIWCDDGEVRKDGAGNEFAPEQTVYGKSVAVYPRQNRKDQPYYVALTAGEHVFALAAADANVYVDKLLLKAVTEAPSYTAPQSDAEYYRGEALLYEGEKPLWKNSYWLVPMADNSSYHVSPSDPVFNKINYIGGGNWKQVGSTITWEVTVPQDGYYQLGFAYRQSLVPNYSSYRNLTIDGEVPFKEAAVIEFPYGLQWEKKAISDENGTPYLFYLKEGSHEVSLQVTLGDFAPICERLEDVIFELGDVYLDMTMLIGETVDISRDYDLFKAIPDLEERLTTALNEMTALEQALITVSGTRGGSYDSVLRNMMRVVKEMLENKYSASKYKSTYYSNYSSLSECVNEMQTSPLDIDRVIVSAAGDTESFEYEGGLVGFWKQTVFTISQFIASFTSDYNNISGVQETEDSITLWVGWGQDQARVLNSMIQTDFTPKSGVAVNVRVTNASIIQAIVSGNGPDCVLQRARTEPVNLAMRNALYDLSQFGDYKEVLKNFAEGAEIPYYYNGGLYALPDTQTFYMMFYRKDILEELDLELPTTWTEFEEVAEILIHNNLTAYMGATASAVATGVGGLGLYPTFLLQNNVPLYMEDGKSTNLLSAEAMKTFQIWTDYYTKMKLPISMDFYNRFRAGTCPIGISQYSVAVTLKAEAPELDGKWGMTTIPGTVQADGSVSQISAGSGTGCSILAMSEKEDKAWEFLKWWTLPETQATYSTNLESILGPTGRVAVSSVEAMNSLSWTKEELNAIQEAWKSVEELPEYPGGYQVSRSIDMAFYNVTNSNKSIKDVLTKWGTEANKEILRKWTQYQNRGKR